MHNSLAGRLRAAVSSGEFRRAEEIWNAYAAERLTEVRRGCGEKLPETRELMEWTRIVVLCARAQALRKLRTRLTEMHAAGEYAHAAR